MAENKDGITLVALVITIIVLLILAGITISLVVGDNGILSRSKQAKAGNIVAEETEQVDLAYSSAFTKNLGDAVSAEDLQEELDKSVGNGKTTVTVDGNSLKVLFNETGHSYNVNNGRVSEGTNGTTGLTDLEMLQIYFGKGLEEIFDDENGSLKNIEPIPDASTSIRFVYTVDDYTVIFQYNEKYYIKEETPTLQISVSDIDFGTFGIYSFRGENILVTPSTPECLIHINYTYIETESTEWYYKGENGPDYTRPFSNGYVTNDEFTDTNYDRHHFYESNGDVADISWR